MCFLFDTFSSREPEPASIEDALEAHAVIAVQFRFLRTIAPIEILVRAERRRALQLLVVNVGFVGFEFDVVAQAAGSESPTMVHGNTARRHCRAGPPQELAV